MSELKKLLFLSALVGLGYAAYATEYYVATTGDDTANTGLSSDSPFATVDKAIGLAEDKVDIIYVAPGTYETTTQWGPQLMAKLIGTGATRDEVVIRPQGDYRTLRTAVDSWIENVTIIGNSDSSKVDKGGAIEMSGGTLTNCVVRDGTSYGDNNDLAGGNIYINGEDALVVDCVISNGFTVKRGGNVYLAKGTVRNCTISGGSSSNVGGNVFMLTGLLEGSTLAGGRSSNTGGNLRLFGSGRVVDCMLSDGTVANEGQLGANAYVNQTGGHLVRCRFTGGTNEAGYASGSLAFGWGPCSAEDCLVEGSACGGVVLEYPAALYNTTIVKNTGYGVWCWSAAKASAVLRNCIVYGNLQADGVTAKEWSGDGLVEGAEFEDCAMNTNGGGWTSAFTTTKSVAASDFVDYAAGDYRLAVSSALVDAGAADPRGEAASATDLAGNPRLSGAVDVGCYEYQHVILYVTPGNTAAAPPYDTPETGYALLRDAVNGAPEAGCEIRLGVGVHEISGQISISKALKIKGLGATPEAVILRNTVETPDQYQYRVLEVNNAKAHVSNLTIENGIVKNQNGGNLRLVTGVVSNCVIRNGSTQVVSSDVGAGAGVELAGGATLTHCVISNNVVTGTANNNGFTGGAVFVSYNAQNGRISNCLIAGNRYVTSGDPKPGAAGLRFGGSNNNTQIENNTIVANVVEGSLSTDSAGLHCTTWYGRMRNNIVAGNFETGKNKFTSTVIDKDHCTFDNNLTDDAEPYTNKSFAAPLRRIFKDFAGGDYRLRSCSPAINSGTRSGLTLLPSVDLAGNPRIYDNMGKSRLDIGCYERQLPPGFAFLAR